MSHKTTALLILYACLGVLFLAAVENVGAVTDEVSGNRYHGMFSEVLNATGEGQIVSYVFTVPDNKNDTNITLQLRPGMAYNVTIRREFE
jgi:hypothetical protein